MILSLVLAASENNVIGDSQAANHAIPWHLPNDFKHFRDLTKGKPVIVGRKTMEKIGRLLPGRRNIVITRGDAVPFEGAERAGSLEEAIELAKQGNPEEICVIGGGEIYRQALSIADRVYLTRVHATVEGDTTFPGLDDAWKEVSREMHSADEEHKYAYTFLVFEKREK